MCGVSRENVTIITAVHGEELRYARVVSDLNLDVKLISLVVGIIIRAIEFCDPGLNFWRQIFQSILFTIRGIICHEVLLQKIGLLRTAKLKLLWLIIAFDILSFDAMKCLQ